MEELNALLEWLETCMKKVLRETLATDVSMQCSKYIIESDIQAQIPVLLLVIKQIEEMSKAQKLALDQYVESVKQMRIFLQEICKYHEEDQKLWFVPFRTKQSQELLLQMPQYIAKIQRRCKFLLQVLAIPFKSTQDTISTIHEEIHGVEDMPIESEFIKEQRKLQREMALKDIDRKRYLAKKRRQTLDGSALRSPPTSSGLH